MSVLTLNVDEVMRTLSAESSNPFVVHDKEVDIVRFAINSGFADIVLDGQVALRVMYQRPGETEVRAQTLTYYDTDGLRSYYDWQLSQSDLAKNGSLMVALCILDISGGEVSEWHTTPCEVRVLSTIHTDDSDEGDDTITPTVKERVAVLESMIQRVASGAPIVVSSVSAMTDTDQIYVLSTDGNWYYHNGSAWVAGGEYGGVANGSVTTDKLADGAVTTAKIADGAITAGKIASGMIDRLLTDAVKTALLQLAQKVAYIDDDGQDYYDDLYDALYPPADLVSPYWKVLSVENDFYGVGLTTAYDGTLEIDGYGTAQGVKQRDDRTSYVDFDLLLNTNYTYEFEFDGNVSIGLPRYDAVPWAGVDDLGWKSSEYVLDPNDGNKNYCFRITLNKGKSDVLASGCSEIRIIRRPVKAVKQNVYI